MTDGAGGAVGAEGPTATDRPDADAGTPNRTDEPTVSVVVPVHEYPEGIEVTLGSLLAQTYPGDRHEILVVVDGDAPETRALVSDYAESHDHLRWFEEDEYHTPGAARNVGVRAAEGEIIAFIDADMTVDDDWLERLVDEFRAMDADYVGCTVEIGPDADDDSPAIRYNREVLFNVEALCENGNFAPTCSLVTTADVFDSVGRFDPRLTSYEDMCFGIEAHEGGVQQAVCSSVSPVHPPRETLREFFERGRKMGHGRHQIRTHHPKIAERNNGTFSFMRWFPPIVYVLTRNRIERWGELSLGDKARFFTIASALEVGGLVGHVGEAVRDLLGRD